MCEGIRSLRGFLRTENGVDIFEPGVGGDFEVRFDHDGAGNYYVSDGNSHYVNKDLTVGGPPVKRLKTAKGAKARLEKFKAKKKKRKK